MANRQVGTLTAGTCCPMVRRLSPERIGRGENLSYVAPMANLARISTHTVATPLFIRSKHVHLFNPRMRKNVMAFPSKGLLVGAVTGSFLYLVGFPGWVAVAFGVLGFLGMGGLHYSKLVVKTLPRDIWLAGRLLHMILTLRRHSANHVTVSDLFTKTAARYPNKIAIIFENQRWTFKELDEYANKVGNHFRAVGLQKGDTVALFMENCPEYLGITLGLCKIGVVSALINFNLRHEALAHCIRISKCSAVVFSPSLSDALCTVLPDLDTALTDSCYSVSEEASLPQAKALDVELQSSSPHPPSPPPNKAFEDKVCYVYTSGTTGLPKACHIRHQRFVQYALGIHSMFQLREDDIIYCTLPLYHTNGGMLSSGQMLFWGSTLALRRKFSASNFWSDCVKHQCTVVFYIGELCRYLLAQPKRPTDTQHRVRLAIGNGLRQQIWSAFQKRFNVTQIGEFYGATEGNASLVNPMNKVGACGVISVLLPMFNPVCIVKVDPETGVPLRNSNGFCVKASVDEPGEIVARITKAVMHRFDGYQDEKATQKKVLRNVFKPGDMYFASGDMLRMDEEGYLYFCDRTGDTFRWKGENVSTMEVEATIANILELRDVVVYGVEVPGTEGRAGMAAIVGDEQTVNLADLGQKLFLSLPLYAVPIFIRLISACDLTGTFKLRKVQLRNEGFDQGKVSDPLYVLDHAQRTYVPLTPEVQQQLEMGNIRL